MHNNVGRGFTTYMKKKLLSGVLALFLFSLLLVPAVNAANIDVWGNQQSEVEGALGLGTQDIRTTVASIINVFMGLLGIVAVVIILVGGFQYMIAGGNDEKIKKAKQWIISGIIGLVIILSAYAIATFVVESVMKAT